MLTVGAALLMSVSTFAQSFTTPQQRVDFAKCEPMPSTMNLLSPKQFQTNMKVSDDCMFDMPDTHAKAFGFDVFDYRYFTNAFIRLRTDNPEGYSMMVDYGQKIGESCGFYSSTFVEDKIFAYCYKYYGPGAMVPCSMGYINPKTGIYEESFALTQDHIENGDFLVDMCYDPETKLVYGIKMIYEDGWPTGKSWIYSVDPFKQEDTLYPIAEVDGEIYTLACDRGNLYGIRAVKGLDGVSTKNSELIKMPISSIHDGEIDVIEYENDLNVRIAWSQTMDFDKINHRLWWFGQTQDDAFFCDIDINTGKINTQTNFSSVAQVVALSIPYQYTASKAPSYPRNFEVAPASEGEAKIKLSWQNPTLDFDFNELQKLDKIQIIRDDKVIGTVSATGIGANQEYEDINVPNGVHIYKIQGVNEFGEGIYKEAKVYVGHDLPTGPSNVSVEINKTDPSKAIISWEAPTIGIDGGWIDQSSLKYDVIRNPGNVKVVSDITECTIEDKVEETAGYVYEITSKNADGIGGTSKSTIISFGPSQTVPFFSDLKSKEEFNKWTAIDSNNDNVTWKWSKWDKVTCYERAEGPADDYFVSPAIKFEEGKSYQIRFKYWTINWVEPSDHSPIMDKMDIYYASEPTAEAFQKEGAICDLGEFHTPSETYLYAKQTFKPQAGTGYLAFHAYSDANRGIIYLQDVCVREYSKTDLSITDFMGSSIVVKDANETYNVEVTNEGSAAVSDYTVEIINSETGEILSSTAGKAVRPGQSIIIPAEWTPKTTGELNVTARVKLEGDTYPDDNTWAEAILTTINPEGSDRWMAINKDESYEDNEGNFYNKGTDLPFGGIIECIYLDKQIPKKDITITGIAFVHDPIENETTGSFSISAQSTEWNYFGWDEEYEEVINIDTNDPDWIDLFDGEAKFGGTAYNNRLEIKFTNPYKYDGGNICFIFSGFAPGAIFHYEDIYDEGEDECHRTCQIGKGVYWWVPVTMFSYVEGEIDGIMGVTQDGLNFDLYNGELNMSEICEHITVYSLDGKIIAEAHNASILSLGTLHGAYIIKAQAGNKKVNCKVNL